MGVGVVCPSQGHCSDRDEQLGPQVPGAQCCPVPQTILPCSLTPPNTLEPRPSCALWWGGKRGCLWGAKSVRSHCLACTDLAWWGLDPTAGCTSSHWLGRKRGRPGVLQVLGAPRQEWEPETRVARVGWRLSACGSSRTLCLQPVIMFPCCKGRRGG